jgi:AcrR family transcriptional regulator
LNPQRLNRAEKQAETRRALLEAAARVLATRGYERASVNEIAEEAGYSHGAVYSNFSSKEELFLALYEEHMAERSRQISDAAAALDAPFSERLRAAADDYMARVPNERETLLLHLEFAVHAIRNPEVNRRLAMTFGAPRLVISRLIEEFVDQENARLPLPPEDLALVIRALGIGLGFERLFDPGSVREDLFGEFVAWLFASIAELGERSAEVDRNSKK